MVGYKGQPVGRKEPDNIKASNPIDSVQTTNMARKLSTAFTLLLALAFVFASLGFSKGTSAAPMPDMDDEAFGDTTDGHLVKRSPRPIPLDQIEILDIQYGGSGCPAGSAAWDLSEDKTGEFVGLI